MQKSITALLALALSGAGLLALAQGDLQVKDTAPDRYVVQRGDTLWSIATKFLSDQWRWPEIWRMNQEQIRNPHNISPGDVLVLDRSVSPPQLRIADSGAGPGLGGAEGVKLLPRIYTQPLTSEAIPAISPKAIEPFLTQPLIIEEGGLDRAPRLIATEEHRVNLGAGNVAYVSGCRRADGPIWQVYRARRAPAAPGQ